MDDNYCRSHLLQPSAYYHNILPDVFDTMAMDFLIGNADRHHFETYALHGIKEGRLMHIDNGKRYVRYFYIVYAVGMMYMCICTCMCVCVWK